MTAKMPDKFKSPSGWCIFAEAMETYLSHLCGSGHIPLKYVIRRLTIPIPNAIYDTEIEENIDIAPLIGEDFQRDNVRVHGVMRQLALKGPGRSYILPYDKTSDGRAAWLRLTAHFEGESYHNRNVEDAYATLDALHYEGERKGFTFEKFVEKHNEAYLELERYGEPALDTKKVHDFIRRINSPELTAAVQQVKANPVLLADFQQTVNFIALSVTPVKPSQRNIGAITQEHKHQGSLPQAKRKEGALTSFDTQTTASSITNPSRYSSNMARGRGRQYATPPSSQKYPRDIPSGRMTNTHGRSFRGGWMNPALGYFTPQQWATLTYDQRDRIMTQRGTKRNVSSISASHKQDQEQSAYNHLEETQGYGIDHHSQSEALEAYDEYYGNGPNTTDEPPD